MFEGRPEQRLSHQLSAPETQSTDQTNLEDGSEQWLAASHGVAVPAENHGLALNSELSSSDADASSTLERGVRAVERLQTESRIQSDEPEAFDVPASCATSSREVSARSAEQAIDV